MPTKIYFFAELLAFLTSLLIIKNQSYPAKMKVLIPYLFITVVIEWVGYYLFTSGTIRSNHSIYNIYVPFSVIFYLYLIYIAFDDLKMSFIFLVSIVIYIVFTLINFLFFQGFEKFASYNFILGGVLISVYCVVFLISLLEQKKLVSLYAMPTFWLISGLILYYLPKSVFYSAFEYLAFVKENSDYVTVLFRSINSLLISILYVFLTFNFLCKIMK